MGWYNNTVFTRNSLNPLWKIQLNSTILTICWHFLWGRRYKWSSLYSIYIITKRSKGVQRRDHVAEGHAYRGCKAVLSAAAWKHGADWYINIALICSFSYTRALLYKASHQSSVVGRSLMQHMSSYWFYCSFVLHPTYLFVSDEDRAHTKRWCSSVSSYTWIKKKTTCLVLRWMLHGVRVVYIEEKLPHIGSV